VAGGGKKWNVFMRLKSFLVLLTLLGASILSHADDASKLAKVHELFQVMKMEQLSSQIMKQVMGQVNSGMMQQLTGPQLNADQQKRMTDFTEKAQNIITSSMGWDQLEPEYAKLYVAAYSEQQLDDILTFYHSPTGQAMIEKNPGLIEQSSTIAQQHMAAAMPQLQQLMKDFMAQADAKKTQSQPQ
jgi:hypothetical protein